MLDLGSRSSSDVAQHTCSQLRPRSSRCFTSGGFSVITSVAGGESFGRCDKGGLLIAGDNVTSDGTPGVVFTRESGKAYRQIGGGMTLSHRSLERETGGFTDIWKDESPTPLPLPSWLQARTNGYELYPALFH